MRQVWIRGAGQKDRGSGEENVWLVLNNEILWFDIDLAVQSCYNQIQIKSNESRYFWHSISLFCAGKRSDVFDVKMLNAKIEDCRNN